MSLSLILCLSACLSVRLPACQVRLGPRNFLRLWSAILCERRTVLVAENVLTLSSCVHAAMAILYPFAWQHVFIPLLPTDMLEYASAPMPFVIGVSTAQDSVAHQRVP